MNKENLLKMADYIETIPQEMFNMLEYRFGTKITPECNSVGCIIGHCTVLDNEPLPRCRNGVIGFDEWSERFTGLDSWSDEWFFLFGNDWVNADNTPTGAAKRIRYFVENGLPNNWEEIIEGEDPLPY